MYTAPVEDIAFALAAVSGLGEAMRTGASGDLVSFGCTAIVAPDGRVMAKVPELSEGVAVQDVPARPVSRAPHGVSVSRPVQREPATG